MDNSSNAVAHSGDVMALTPKQEAFAKLIALSKPEDGMTQTEAYRQAYNSENMTDKTIWEKASLLASDDKVRARIEELRDKVAQVAIVTLAEHLQELKSLRDAARDDLKFGPAIQAEVARGKACGLYVERVEVTNKTDELDEIKAARDFLRSRGVPIKEPTTLQ
jgi:phage terminase small subunit